VSTLVVLLEKLPMTKMIQGRGKLSSSMISVAAGLLCLSVEDRQYSTESKDVVVSEKRLYSTS